MKQRLILSLALATVMSANAATVKVTVTDKRCQTITGFGAAACDGAMRPFANDTQPAKLLYGAESPIGLNIMRMEISPNMKGNITAADVGWDTPYDWYGSVPSAKIVKQRGGIVFGTPWSPPGEFKTNGTAQGGNAADQGNQRGQLREDCYEKFFPWLNSFLKYMKNCGVAVDAVSVQNEPDWWVSYSGCLYTPQQQLNLVKNHADALDKATYGVRLISAEPLGFDPSYSNLLLNDSVARKHIDIIAGHIYGHPPLVNMKNAAVLAEKYGKEVWMTEHSSTDNIGDRLPNWHEQLLFAEELNECMLAGCTGYIYWYMRAHWAFVSTGEAKYGAENKTKNKLLPRAYIISHFAKHVTGSTRLDVTHNMTIKTEAAFETSAYIKGDSLIVMAIDTTKTAHELQLTLPANVRSGVHLLSTDNTSLCQEAPITISEPTNVVTVSMPARSLSTYIFIIDNSSNAIEEKTMAAPAGPKTYYDLHGRRLDNPRGICIERGANGTSRKICIE
ncbi:MAG: endo-1,4-beta-xylanase xyn5A [Prevotella sp.]|nr:endo-1,4-beta-xylanase xyn5A [Prevotella sp.]